MGVGSLVPFRMFLGVCQKCRVPLKVNCNKPLQESSLMAFTGTGLAAMDGPSPPADEVQQTKHASAVRMLGESFVVLANDPGKRGSGDGGAGGSGAAPHDGG